jgi:small conductance mechanosensitive channel
MKESLTTVDQLRTTVLDLLVRFGPRLLAAILILAIGFFASRWTARWLTRALQRIDLEPPVRVLLARIVQIAVLLLFVIMSLQNLGVELLPLIAGLGIAGAGVALAMQGVLGNVAAGLTIIFTKPFRVTEYISIAGEEGRVVAITLFSTTLGHADGSLVVIPNRKIVGEILHNFGQTRQLDITVGVAYDTDLDAALAAIAQVLRSNPRVLKDPIPVVQTIRLADSCMNIGVRPWVGVPDYGAATGEINRAIVEAFRERSIVIPVPQLDVRLVSGVSSKSG